MSSVLLIEPILFGADPNIKDNAFTPCPTVSNNQASIDHATALALLQDLRRTMTSRGVPVTLIRMLDDPHGSTVYASRGDAIYSNNSISFHNFTDSEGRVVRRLVILYPMSLYRRRELPQVQLIDRLEKAANEGVIDLLDLRHFESQNRVLEGTGALNFSHDGKFVYMSRSGRTDDGLLDIVCSEENLGIPLENRFLFQSAIPRKDGSGEDVIYHTNIVGWCGNGICAWALDMLHFESDAERGRFHAHLNACYKCVVNLTQTEIETFAGNAFELVGRAADGAECRFLCLSSTALGNLTTKNRQLLEAWYGAENLVDFGGDVLERRSGGSIRCAIGASVVVGPCEPSFGQQSTLAVARVLEKMP